MNETILRELQKFDTPTICNAIEVVQGKRGFDRFTRKTMHCSAPEEGSIVGYARTAKISGNQPPTDPQEIVRQRRMDYYKHMAESTLPAVVVIEDMDYPDCIGAFWGEVNTTVHKGFGLSGAITNGVMRDLGSLPDQFPVIAGSIGPSHGFVHVTNIDCSVEIFGMKINPGEIVHADRHGALVIPNEVLMELPSAIKKLQETENIVLEPASSEGFDFDTFSEAWKKFESART